MAIRTLRRKSTANIEDYSCPPSKKPSLIETLALLMLRQACNNAPWLAQDGYAVAVQVPSLSWTKLISEAMTTLVAETRLHDIEHVSVKTLEKFDSEDNDCTYIEFVKGTEKRTYGNDVIAEVLSSGKTLISFSVSERQLPVNLVRSIDVTVIVQPVKWATLEKAVASHFGSRPTVNVSDALCTKIEPDDITLALRPKQTADEYLTRLTKLLGTSASSADEVDDSVPLLNDVHGMTAAVEWGQSLAQDMAEYSAGRISWHDVDKGVLLVGRPGTGKTTFVKSLVKTLSQTCKAEVQFIYASYAKWQRAGHLNDFLKAMAHDFDIAAEAKPSVLFIDEMDSFVDRARTRGDNAEYCRQTVNGLLELLDGTAKREGIVVVGATNDPRQIDPALLRPGRMDKIINIPLPDVVALQGIFRQHAGSDLGDLTELARLARGASGAQVEQWCRLARRQARSERRDLTRDDLISVVSAAVGPARSAESLRVAAVHEAGHAFVIAGENPDNLAFVSIGGAGGGIVAGMTASTFDGRPTGLVELKSLLRQSLGGRAAELVVLGRVTDGSGGGRHSDLGRAASMAALAVLSHGLVDETPRWYSGSNDCAHVLVIRPDLAEQVDKLLSEAWQATLTVVRSGRVAVRKIADELLVSETLQADAVLDIIEASKKHVIKPSLSDTSDEHEQMYRC